MDSALDNQQWLICYKSQPTSIEQIRLFMFFNKIFDDSGLKVHLKTYFMQKHCWFNIDSDIIDEKSPLAWPQGFKLWFVIKFFFFFSWYWRGGALQQAVIFYCRLNFCNQIKKKKGISFGLIFRSEFLISKNPSGHSTTTPSTTLPLAFSLTVHQKHKRFFFFIWSHGVESSSVGIWLDNQVFQSTNLINV